jgi:sulfonate transport system ATP-binding protein
VLEARPGRIERIVNVDVPHPRDRDDERLKALTDEVRGAILDRGRGGN